MLSISKPSIVATLLPVAKQAHRQNFCDGHFLFAHGVTVPLFLPFKTFQVGGGGENMSSISCHRSSRLGLGATRTLPAEPSVFFADLWKAFQLFAVALTAVTLAACAQSSVFTDHSALAPGRQASLDSHTKASFVSNRHVAFVAKERASSTTQEHAKETRDASYGLASFYGNGSETASGERFNADELTAAHRTLPFGTRVRVTNHSNGRSVVVRINDRGPFVTGRIIDVTPAAAHALGMSGLAPVTVERE
jgi:rare lipoprotein A